MKNEFGGYEQSNKKIKKTNFYKECGASIMAQLVKKFVTKSEDLSLIPKDPHGEKREPTPTSCPWDLLSICTR